MFDHFHHSYPWRILILAKVAKALGLLIHVEGRPYGSSRNILRGVGETSQSCGGVSTLGR